MDHVPDTIKERSRLIKRLKNQKTSVPNLLSFLPGWRCKVQLDVDATREKYDTWLNRYALLPPVTGDYYI
jgi:hypothetical protein